MAHSMPYDRAPRPRMRPVILHPDLVARVHAVCALTGDAFDDVIADAITLHHDAVLCGPGDSGAVMTAPDLDDPSDAPSFSAEIGLICFWLAFGCIGAIAIAAAIDAGVHLLAFMFSGIVE